MRFRLFLTADKDKIISECVCLEDKERKVIKVETAVKRETLYIGVSVVILSALMEAVFLIIQRWDLTVLSGNLLGGLVAVLNFFLMGLTVQKAVAADEKQARSYMNVSRNYRTIMMLLAVVIAGVAPIFNLIATVIPLLFPRIAILVRPFVGMSFSGSTSASVSTDADTDVSLASSDEDTDEATEGDNGHD